MPLFDSIGSSSSQAVRLPKFTSIPTTEDLKYALAESRKYKGKIMELPFEHATNHLFFVVRLAVNPQLPHPSWTLVQGDGPGGKVLWTRQTSDILMIQNKITMDCRAAGQQQNPDGVAGAVDTPAEDYMTGARRKREPQEPQGGPIVLGGGGSAPSGSGPIVMSSSPSTSSSGFNSPPVSEPADTNPQAQSGSHAAYAIPGSSYLDAPAPPTLDAFFAPQDYPAPLTSFLDAPGQPQQQAQQPPAQAAPPNMVPPAVAPPQAAPPPSQQTQNVPPVPLPEPIKFDKTVLNQVHRQLSDPATGLMTFPAFVFFLFREFVRFQKFQTPFAVVVFELAVRTKGQVLPLPPSAVSVVADRIRQACSPLDVVMHVSGGEFGALLANSDGPSALDFAAGLHEALTSEPLFPGNREASVLISVGAASIPETCAHPEVLVAAARQAKELAKPLPTPYLLFPVKK